MKTLMMFLGNDLIESIPLNPKDIQQPGYVGHFKRQLKIKYSELLQESPERPEFLVVDPQPQQNSAKSQRNVQ